MIFKSEKKFGAKKTAKNHQKPPRHKDPKNPRKHKIR
jgi:hypothetical protein